MTVSWCEFPALEELQFILAGFIPSLYSGIISFSIFIPENDLLLQPLFSQRYIYSLQNHHPSLYLMKRAKPKVQVVKPRAWQEPHLRQELEGMLLFVCGVRLTGM